MGLCVYPLDFSSAGAAEQKVSLLENNKHSRSIRGETTRLYRERPEPPFEGDGCWKDVAMTKLHLCF